MKLTLQMLREYHATQDKVLYVDHLLDEFDYPSGFDAREGIIDQIETAFESAKRDLDELNSYPTGVRSGDVSTDIAFTIMAIERKLNIF